MCCQSGAGRETCALLSGLADRPVAIYRLPAKMSGGGTVKPPMPYAHGVSFAGPKGGYRSRERGSPCRCSPGYSALKER